MSGMDTVNVSGKDIKAAVTEECVILTVIDIPLHVRRSELLEHFSEADLKELGLDIQIRHGAGIDVKEHDSVKAALKYLDSELRDGDWDRAYIINPERLRYREAPADARKRQPTWRK